MDWWPHLSVAAVGFRRHGCVARFLLLFVSGKDDATYQTPRAVAVRPKWVYVRRTAV